MAYKVAVTSATGEAIDLHFGQATEFHILEVDAATGGWRRTEVREWGPSDAPPGNYPHGGHSDAHFEEAAALLSDCAWLLTAKIGPKPYRILRQKGINCLESPSNLPAALAMLNRYVVGLR